MEYLNDTMREIDTWTRLRMATLPRLYFARSIKDFLDNKGMVRPTSLARAFGKTFLHGPSSGDCYLPGAGVIIFYNLHHSVQENSVLLEDITGSLEAQMPPECDAYLASLSKQGIGERDRVQYAEMLYYPGDGSRQMWGVKKMLNIPAGELTSREAASFAFSPAFGF
jgi:hypothetical protein